ncbi:MAG: ATP synthase F1 subunit gamma [Phycisphaerales bacterium]|nr:ATP synthase F1 subunit gamma [Phycisphaerales bacterium]
MAQIREIKKRMVAVRTIQRITKTMQMIATAKFTASLSRAKASRPYMERIRELVAEVAARAGDESHPLCLAPAKPAGKELILVIASDRGLCGAYNGHVLRTSLIALKGVKSRNAQSVVETIGKKATAFFKFQKVPVAQKHQFGDRPTFEMVEPLAERLMSEYLAGEYDACRIVYMKFVSNSKQVPETMQLLPMRVPAAAKSGIRTSEALYEFSPNASELLNDLLPRAVKISLFQAILDAIVSENVMRMIAMKAATDNASGIAKSLHRSYNRARQGRITTELTEIISGAAALE